jgi:hypothetical protein
MRPQRVGVTTAAMHYSFTRRSAPPYCSAGAAGRPMPHVATHDRARTPGGDPEATPRRPRARTAGPLATGHPGPLATHVWRPNQHRSGRARTGQAGPRKKMRETWPHLLTHCDHSCDGVITVNDDCIYQGRHRAQDNAPRPHRLLPP